MSMATKRLGAKSSNRCEGRLLAVAVITCASLSLLSSGSVLAGQGQRQAAMKVAKKATASPSTATAPSTKQSTDKETAGNGEGGRRDPFFIPPAPKPGDVEGMGPEAGPLPPGKRGLVVGQLILEGIVRQESSNTMIAVVTNSSNRAYFLRENDELYNGVVSKITPDSVQFTENYRDFTGQMNSRQVVKRLGSGPGENR